MIRFVWTDDAVALLRLYGNKISPRDIAAMLGTTRCAVLCKAARCGIPLRDRDVASQTKEARARRSASMKAHCAARQELYAAKAAAARAAKRTAALAAAR